MAECPRPTDWLAGYQYLCDQVAAANARIDDTQRWVAETFVYAMHGVMDMNTPTAGASWGAGWVPITQFDSSASWTSPSITFNTTAGTVAFANSGVYQLVLGMSVGINESNSGRETDIRVYNVTLDAPTNVSTSLGIARNQPMLNYSATVQFQVLPGEENQAIRFDIGNGDSVTGVVWESLALIISNVGASAGAA